LKTEQENGILLMKKGIFPFLTKIILEHKEEDARVHFIILVQIVICFKEILHYFIICIEYFFLSTYKRNYT
jgi:hypothetical protein